MYGHPYGSSLSLTDAGNSKQCIDSCYGTSNNYHFPSNNQRGSFVRGISQNSRSFGLDLQTRICHACHVQFIGGCLVFGEG